MSLAIITPGWVASACKTAKALAKKTKLCIIIPKGKLFQDLKNNKKIKLYEMREIYIPAPANFTITPGLPFTIQKAKKEQKPKCWIVFKHMFTTGFSVPILRLMRQRVILVTDTFPGHIWWTRSKAVNFVMWCFARTFGLLFLKTANKVVLLHEGLKETAKKLNLNYTVIHNGVDLEEYKKARHAKDLSFKFFVKYFIRLNYFSHSLIPSQPYSAS